MLVDKGVQSHCQSINIVRPEEQAGHQVVVPAIDEGKNRNCRQSRHSLFTTLGLFLITWLVIEGPARLIKNFLGGKK